MNPPVIIIGAGRSGTNALRDALCMLDDFVTWPCDEINYIWRFGNRSFPTDELLPQHATQMARNRIKSEFANLQASSGVDKTVIEKTCANTLRVGFVAEVLPDAKFVHIVRDGRAVTASAMQRWKASLDLPYLFRKARFVPVQDLPYYAASYLRTRFAKLGSEDGQLSWWGPKFAGMDDLRRPGTPLAKVCAAQWKRCVESAMEQFADLESGRVMQITYENFVTNPDESISQILSFLGTTVDSAKCAQAAATIRSGSRDGWRKRISNEDLQQIGPIVDPVLKRLGYEL